MILNHDGYEKLDSTNKVLPGDVVIYRSHPDDGAEIIHSGIVIEVQKALVFNPRVLSKWGFAHEVIHFLTDAPYPNAVHEYYRVMP